MGGPRNFQENYIAYFSAGTTIPPEEKLKKNFGIEIIRQLLEDAMDVVELRIQELNELKAEKSANDSYSAAKNLNTSRFFLTGKYKNK